jgi:hypothetical protein
MKVSTRIIRLVALGLLALALAAPMASARPAPVDTPNGPVTPDPAPVVQSVNDGFDWGSAAIGAGAAASIILLISVGGTTYRHRHSHIGVAH